MRDQMGPDFIEALARGLDVIRAFESGRPTMSLSEVAAAAGLARATARRILLTLEELGYVRSADGLFALTPRVLELGMAYIGSSSIWEIARPHMERLVARTGESSSLAQLDGSDIVYVARVAVPKVVTFAVAIGTRFPALQLGTAIAVTIAVGRPLVDSGFRGAVAAAVAGAAVAFLIARARPAAGTAAPDRADTSASP